MALRNAPRYNQHYGDKVQTDSAVEPISDTELFNYLKLSDEHELEYLNDLIPQCRVWIEDFTGLAFITQTRLLTLDKWPGYVEAWWDGVREMATTELYTMSRPRDIEVPRYPLQSITTINVYDEDSNATAVTVGTTFDVDVNSKRGRITLKRGSTWPTATRANNAIEITYVAGYGNAATDVPASLRRAVLEMAAYMYSHRGDCTQEEGYRKSGAHSILNTYRVREI